MRRSTAVGSTGIGTAPAKRPMMAITDRRPGAALVTRVSAGVGRVASFIPQVLSPICERSNLRALERPTLSRAREDAGAGLLDAIGERARMGSDVGAHGRRVDAPELAHCHHAFGAALGAQSTVGVARGVLV